MVVMVDDCKFHLLHLGRGEEEEEDKRKYLDFIVEGELFLLLFESRTLTKNNNLLKGTRETAKNNLIFCFIKEKCHLLIPIKRNR